MAAKFLGQFLLEQGLIDRQQLLDALDAQRASNPLLGELAVAAGMLDPGQAQRINERQRREDRRFGDIARDMELLTAPQVDALLARQKAGRKLFGEILIEQGALTRDALDTALKAHGADRDEAMEALHAEVAAHPSGAVMDNAIGTCTRLFPRLLKTQCQFSSLVAAPADAEVCEVVAHVRIHAQPQLLVAVATDRGTAANICDAFLSLPAGSGDEALAQDALGELVNVLMGYVVKDALADDAGYHASPPAFDVPASQLLASEPGAIAVKMTSQLGSFVLLVAVG